ncbi:hypothetical protein SUDANB121_03772 [Nocardiopsis dassonvillei]|uniref:hypothetical protein n=1 Tax=Nocardiopsis dassonvillei TaxID=2014 RepID=UPI003F5503D7
MADVDEAAPAGEPGPPGPEPVTGRTGGRWAPRPRGAVTAALTALVALAVAFRGPRDPGAPGRTVGERAAPWSVLAVPAAAVALVRRSVPAGPAALLLLAVRLPGPGRPLASPDPRSGPT